MAYITRTYSPEQLQAIIAGETEGTTLVSNEIVDLGGYYSDRVTAFVAEDDHTYVVHAQAGPPDEWTLPAFEGAGELTAYAVEPDPTVVPLGWRRVVVADD
ncbi:hypothetical protein [Ancylobacter defluvii]|uniref:Uncharacterized protein n=1 Tax=Ancylobacter defluvii TaxID=1282440 RepID=A0A9W6JZZ4_9HYPH|nr:hypothetical protein [Ancylobacter defluvii]MBS7586390.1 hypothetical protein [Ancylobacter defluvii]GLK85671.1 hypothetical protein GCM10017653_37410 [Ancylobacter defluvii]